MIYEPPWRAPNFVSNAAFVASVAVLLVTLVRVLMYFCQRAG